MVSRSTKNKIFVGDAFCYCCYFCMHYEQGVPTYLQLRGFLGPGLRKLHVT